MLDHLNELVAHVPRLPRVAFDAECGDVAERWIKKRHANGAVHEPGTIAAFMAAALHKEPNQIYDVGAHFGYFTLLASTVLHADKVTSFEMHAGIYDIMCRNAWGRKVRPINAAITDRTEKAVPIWISGFHIFEEPAEGWEFLKDNHDAQKHQGKGMTKVDFLTLDDYCKDHAPPDIIKIDVEEYQAKAILGGMKTFAEHRPVIIVELHDTEKISRMGITNASTVKPLFDLGYRGFWCPNFRDADARFEAVETTGDKHERLSIMVLA